MNALLKLLDVLRNLNEGESIEIKKFEMILNEIANLRSPQAVIPLMRLFRDDAQYDELMFSIIHCIEALDDKNYVNQVLLGVPEILRKSPRWASIIFMRIINSEPTRLELIRQVRDCNSDIKNSVRILMEKINARSLQFLPKTTSIIIAASAD